MIVQRNVLRVDPTDRVARPVITPDPQHYTGYDLVSSDGTYLGRLNLEADASGTQLAISVLPAAARFATASVDLYRGNGARDQNAYAGDTQLVALVLRKE